MILQARERKRLVRYHDTRPYTGEGENVRQARALACTNPDLDADFYDFYKGDLWREISELLHTKNETLILDGEGIFLGLEAACATLTEKGDRELVMDNGEYGKRLLPGS